MCTCWVKECFLTNGFASCLLTVTRSAVRPDRSTPSGGRVPCRRGDMRLPGYRSRCGLIHCALRSLVTCRPSSLSFTPMQLVKGNAFAGTVFASYGCFWMNWFFFSILTSTNVQNSVPGNALQGVYVFCVCGLAYGVAECRLCVSV